MRFRESVSIRLFVVVLLVVKKIGLDPLIGSRMGVRPSAKQPRGSW
jgi:hypothetical protein